MITLDEPRDQTPGRKTRRFIRRDVPICPVHDREMRRYMTRGRTRYYKCPHPNCPTHGDVFKSIERVE